MKKLALVSLFALAASSLVACSSSESAPTDDDAVGGDEPEVVTARQQCSREAYDAAFAKYKSAVEHSKARARGQVCEEGTMLGEIANDLGSAVASCGQFESIIKTSQWAAPAREALKGNLALPVLTGEVEVKDASGKLVFSGLEAALAKGITIYGPAPGVYGNVSKIEFKAGGAAKLSVMEFDDEGMPTWKEESIKWRVRGNELTLTLSQPNVHETTYQIEVESWGDGYEKAPTFLFKPTIAADEFRSMPSECEA